MRLRRHRRTQSQAFPLPSSEFDVSSIAGLVADFDPRYGVALSGSDVTSWTDQQSSHVMTGAVSERPTFTAADSNLNNHPSIRIDTGLRFTMPDHADFDFAVNGMDWIAVLYDYGRAGSETLIDRFDVGSSPWSGWRWNTDGSGDLNRALIAKPPSTFANINGGGSGATNAHVYRLSYTGTSDTSEASAQSDNGTPGTATVTATDTGLAFEIGAVGGAEYGNFALARLLRYDHKLSSGDWSTLYSYLSGRYL